jgi:hypothetical protein
MIPVHALERGKIGCGEPLRSDWRRHFTTRRQLTCDDNRPISTVGGRGCRNIDKVLWRRYSTVAIDVVACDDKCIGIHGKDRGFAGFRYPSGVCIAVANVRRPDSEGG